MLSYFPKGLHEFYRNIQSVKNFKANTESTIETKYLGATLNSKPTSRHKFPASAYTKLQIEGAYSLFMARQPVVGQVLLIVEATLARLVTILSVRLLWTSDKPDAATYT